MFSKIFIISTIVVPPELLSSTQLIQLQGLQQSQKRIVMTLNQKVKEIPKWNATFIVQSK